MSIQNEVAVVHEGLPAHLRLFARDQPCVNSGVRAENTALTVFVSPIEGRGSAGVSHFWTSFWIKEKRAVLDLCENLPSKVLPRVVRVLWPFLPERQLVVPAQAGH